MDYKNVEASRNWPLEPQYTALLVVDMQASELQAEVQEAHPEFKEQLGVMLPKVTDLVDRMRAKGCEIVYTVIEALTMDGRDVGLDHKLSEIFIPKGSKLAKIPPEGRQQVDDIVLSKTSSGVFNSTNISYVLRNMGIRNVVVAGLLTDQCVDMAVRDGADLGFYMVCAHEACASRTHERHQIALEAFGGYCKVQGNDEIIADIKRA